jgi:hypothetical protein
MGQVPEEEIHFGHYHSRDFINKKRSVLSNGERENFLAIIHLNNHNPQSSSMIFDLGEVKDYQAIDLC